MLSAAITRWRFKTQKSQMSVSLYQQPSEFYLIFQDFLQCVGIIDPDKVKTRKPRKFCFSKAKLVGNNSYTVNVDPDKVKTRKPRKFCFSKAELVGNFRK